MSKRKHARKYRIAVYRRKQQQKAAKGGQK